MKLAVILDTFGGAAEVVQKYQERSDILFELRLDKDLQLLELLQDPSMPLLRVIVSLRSSEEGGDHSDLTQRSEILKNVMEYNPAYLDLEINHDMDLLPLLQSRGITAVCSLHDYQQPMYETSNQFLQILRQNNLSSDRIIIKFVGDPTDPLDLLQSLKLLKSELTPSVILGVGTHGILSRTMMSQFKQEFVFGAPDSSYNIPTYDQLLPLLDTEEPILTGLLGKRLGHSLSPQIHQIFMKQCNMIGYYHLFQLADAQRAAQFIQEMASTPSQGMNVTFPYKQIALEVADQIDLSVKKAGSANVICYQEDGIKAYNTDISGFAKFLHNHELEKYKSALIVGAGSAGRTVGQVLLDEEIEVTFVNRSRERFNELSPDLKQATTQLVYHDYNLSEIYDLYINSTTLGYDGVLVTDFIDFNNEIKAVIDLNYGRDKTPLVRYAEQRGMTAFDGKEMLFHQAADAFEIWTDCKIAREKAFEEFLRVLK